MLKPTRSIVGWPTRFPSTSIGFLFFDINNHVVLFRSARRIARRLLANQDLAIRVRDVERTLGFGDLVRAQQITGRQRNGASYRVSLRALDGGAAGHAIDDDVV